MDAVEGDSIGATGRADGTPTAGHTARQVLQRLARVARRVADADEAAILLRGDGDSLIRVAGKGRPGAPAVAAWHAGTGAVGRALTTGKPAVESGPVGSARAAAPLLISGRTCGVLAITAASAPGFDGDQLELLRELAEIAAASLEHAETRARAAVSAGVDVLAGAVDMRDDYTGQHSHQVGALARRVGRRLGMAPEDIDALECAARLHDVGKLGVPDAILQKPGPLDEAEWKVMRRHPDWGADMVSRMPGLERMARLVRAHHERWDGSGYPEGLAGDSIPLASRVIGVCDAFQAMVSRRPYRDALSVEDALAELTQGAGSQFDPAVVTAIERENGRNGGTQTRAARG